MPCLVIEEFADADGSAGIAAWESPPGAFPECLEDENDLRIFYTDGNGDLRAFGFREDGGASRFLFRLFRPGVCPEDRQWLALLIGNADELDAALMEEVCRLTEGAGRYLENGQGEET